VDYCLPNFTTLEFPIAVSISKLWIAALLFAHFYSRGQDARAISRATVRELPSNHHSSAKLDSSTTPVNPSVYADYSHNACHFHSSYNVS
jgi:hypothetical protein